MRATMFRTTFQSVDETVDDVVYESCSVVQEAPTVFEGRVGRFGKVQRVGGADRKTCWQEAELMDSKYAPCLQGVTQDETGTQPAIFLDAQILRDFAAVECRATANVRSSKDDEETCSVSSRSTRSDCSDLSSASESSIADMNALQRDKKPWEEPLLAAHQQFEVDARAAKAAKIEAERAALQERLETARLQQEVHSLSNHP